MQQRKIRVVPPEEASAAFATERKAIGHSGHSLKMRSSHHQRVPCSRKVRPNLQLTVTVTLNI